MCELKEMGGGGEGGEGGGGRKGDKKIIKNDKNVWERKGKK